MSEINVFIMQHQALCLGVFIVILLLLFVEWMRTRQTALSLPATEAVQKMNHEQAVILDIRPAEEFKRAHIIDAHSLPKINLTESAKKLGKYKQKPLIIVCQAGTESRKVAANLIHQGFQAYALKGGMRAWLGSELPVIKDNRSATPENDKT